jgi:hypothetical protein
MATTGTSGLLCLILSSCYLGRQDAFAAITVFPVWMWLAPGLAFALAGIGRRGNRLVVAAVTAWLIFILVLAEERWSLLRLVTSPGLGTPEVGRGQGESIRVVSLNCNVGNSQAVEEVARYQPDIVLLQESPGRDAMRELGKKLFGVDGSMLPGVDASLIVRGRVIPADLAPGLRSYFVQGRVILRSGTEVEVICTRLVPAVFRLDLWSPDCWREQRENRRKRREQLRVIVQRLDSVPALVPLIVGGDFNAPQGDAVFRLLRPRLHDAFREGGRGWGNTVTNDVPFLRIDHVWASEAFRAVNVVARSTRHSDHRMVVCDLVLRARQGPPGVKP